MEAQRLQQASIATQNQLKHVAQSQELRALSHLSLPEIDAAVNVVAQIVPAGNVPGLILSGLARLPGRKPPLETMHRDIDLLFSGVNQALDQALYGAFFAGPAAVIWGYQHLLKLAGKDPLTAFPEGTWQFYVDYALREDSARHANETQGFDSLLGQHQVQLSFADRISAWVMSAIYTLAQYPALLENEWRERVATALLHQITLGHSDANTYARLYQQWEKQRPYMRGADATASEDYPRYRRLKFDRFLEEAMRGLDRARRHQWQQALQQATLDALPAYQQQMSILAYLEPHAYGEQRRPISLQEAHVGVIVGGHYYLLPVCQQGSNAPMDVHTVRRQVETLLQYPAESLPNSLIALARTERAALPALQQGLSAGVAAELQELRFVPILLNFDQSMPRLHLAQIRQGERGIGSHALSIFDTGESQVFDQSHIFFDGAWGAALAEIMTNEALSWAVYLSGLAPAQALRVRPYAPALQFTPADRKLIAAAPKLMPEASAENDGLRLRAILALRKQFKQRSDLLRLTVNDLLILYRAIHALSYVPDSALVRELKRLGPHPALEALTQQYNPAILIPVDASQRSPRERLYPMNFEVPLAELDLLRLHKRVIAALDDYQQGQGNRDQSYATFDELQRSYLATLAAFGEVMSRAKEIAIAGESASVGTIRLLAHMPTPLQRLLDQVPNRLDMLNDMIKGREVFSNVGMVAKSSTLRRFISAKDDNRKKILVWGVITDAQGVMRISLRDFRPHVALLAEKGRYDLAQQLAQNYLQSYVDGLNAYIADLQRITATSRETHLYRGDLKLNDE